MELLDLPDELIMLAIRNLKIGDLCSVRLVCTRLEDVSKCDTLWKFLCVQDFPVTENELWDGWRYIDFYQKALFPYRFMFGWWQRDLQHYGGLFRICVERDGIHCYECLPPLDRSFLDCPDLQPYFNSSKPSKPLSEQELLRKYVYNSFDSDISDKTSDSEEDMSTGCISILSTSDYSPSSRSQMRFNKIFSLRSVGKDLRLYCYQSLIGLEDKIGHRTCQKCETHPGHDCQVQCGSRCFVSKDENGFRLVCDNKNAHDTMNFNYWFELDHGFHVNGTKMLEKTLASLFYFSYYHVKVKRFKTLAESCSTYDFQKLKLSANVPTVVMGLGTKVEENSAENNMEDDAVMDSVDWRMQLVKGAPILPGVYFGTYSVHGWELLQLSYQYELVTPSTTENADCFWVLIGWKITGDSNVPACQESFRIFLNKPLHLSGSESSEELQAAVGAAKQRNFRLSVAEEDFQKQKFGIPANFEPRFSGWTLPEVCRGRFFGQGQIAGENFRNPSLTECVFSFFDDQTFSILWLELDAVAGFYRSEQQPC